VLRAAGSRSNTLRMSSLMFWNIIGVLENHWYF
jgi:hypothetical protein